MSRNLKRLFSSVTFASMIIAPPVIAAAQAQEPKDEEQDKKDERKLRLELLWDWETVRSPVVSPDGTKVVFTRSWNDKVNDKIQSELWIMNADGSRQRMLAQGSDAAWSPDGTRVAFIAEGKPKGPQIHVMWVDTREVVQITRVDEAPAAVRWSPDGRLLSFRMVVPEKEGFDIKLPPRPKGAQWAEDSNVITRLVYRRDQSGYVPAGYQHLFVVDADGGTARQVTEGEFDHGPAEWGKGSRTLFFSANRVEDADWQPTESNVYSVDVETREVRQWTTRLGPDTSPLVSPDGRHVAYLGYDDLGDSYHVADLCVLDVATGESRLLTGSLDRDIRGLIWSRDSTLVYLNVDDRGTRNLYSMDLDGELVRLTHGEMVFSANDVDESGTLYGVLADPMNPGDIVRVQPIEGVSADFQSLTRVNDDLLSRLDVGATEEFWIKSVDDFDVQGWVVKPPMFDSSKKYPLILQIHGGPHAMYDCAFSFERHNHAAEGYVLVYTNPRGSTGYGKRFGNAIENAYPGLDYDDLMRCVDSVVARGYVDERNLFVYGGSGGGVLTCWIVGHTERFRAAVSMFPVTDWISFVGTTDGVWWYRNFQKLPWEDISEHWNRSPLKYVGSVKTPTMLITGDLDLRTPMAQTEEYYQALKLCKVDTVMVRVPDEYHGAAGRHVSNLMRRILYVRGWFEKYQLKDEALTTTPAAGG